MISHHDNGRLGGIFVFFIAVYAIIFLNLFFIQVIRSSFYVELGKQQYEIVLSIAPPRAAILDRTRKNFLALNKESIAAFILPHKIQEHEKLSKFLLHYFPTAHQRLKNRGNAHFLYVKRRLTEQEIELIKTHDIKDIHFLNEPNRFYPLRSAAPVVGITDIDNKGLFGIEFSFDKSLSGVPAVAHLEKDARSGNFYFEKTVAISGDQGSDITTTLSSDLQFLVSQELQTSIEKFDAKEGAVLIVDPSNGDVLVMSCFPTFDPNSTVALDLETTKNGIIANAYELGSVFKVFAALAALEEKVVTADELIDCHNVATTYLDGRKINTVESSVRGVIPFYEVISVSNNIGIAQVAQRLSDKLYHHYKLLGFGKKTGIQLPGEHAGFINHPDNWSKQSIISLSYGYEVSATLLQLAQAFCIIANDGYLVTPRILLDGKKEAQQKSERKYSHESIETIRSILENTTLAGTAKKAAVKGYKVMSKTGTANMLVNGVYDTKRNMYTCAGIVERGNYKRVIVTFVKEANRPGLYASTVAAPLFERVAQKVLIHDKVIA